MRDHLNSHNKNWINYLAYLVDNLSIKSVSYSVGQEKVYNLSELNLKHGSYLLYSYDHGADKNHFYTYGILRIHASQAINSLYSNIITQLTDLIPYLEVSNDKLYLKFKNEITFIRNRNYSIHLQPCSSR